MYLSINFSTLRALTYCRKGCQNNSDEKLSLKQTWLGIYFFSLCLKTAYLSQDFSKHTVWTGSLRTPNSSTESIEKEFLKDCLCFDVCISLQDPKYEFPS